MTKTFSITAVDYATLELTVSGVAIRLTVNNGNEKDTDGDRVNTLEDQTSCIAAMLAYRGIEIGREDLANTIVASKMALDNDAFQPTSSTGFLDAKGVEIEAPAGYVERRVLPVDGESIENPVYESHKRGSNWAAICTGKNAANMDRDFLPQRGKIIDISRLTSGDVVEIAGDYTSSGGNKSNVRVPAVVLSISEDEMVLDVYSSVAKAMSAGNKGIRSVAAKD
jgi:hypothetical protein